MKLIKQPVKIETDQMFRYRFCHSLISKKTVYIFVSSKLSKPSKSVRKLIFRFFRRGKTQREIADLTDTSKSSVNQTVVNLKKLAAYP